MAVEKGLPDKEYAVLPIDSVAGRAAVAGEVTIESEALLPQARYFLKGVTGYDMALVQPDLTQPVATEFIRNQTTRLLQLTPEKERPITKRRIDLTVGFISGQTETLPVPPLVRAGVERTQQGLLRIARPRSHHHLLAAAVWHSIGSDKENQSRWEQRIRHALDNAYELRPYIYTASNEVTYESSLDSTVLARHFSGQAVSTESSDFQRAAQSIWRVLLLKQQSDVYFRISGVPARHTLKSAESELIMRLLQGKADLLAPPDTIAQVASEMAKDKRFITTEPGVISQVYGALWKLQRAFRMSSNSRGA